jgi:hypothetical protein
MWGPSAGPERLIGAALHFCTTDFFGGHAGGVCQKSAGFVKIGLQTHVPFTETLVRIPVRIF